MVVNSWDATERKTEFQFIEHGARRSKHQRRIVRSNAATVSHRAHAIRTGSTKQGRRARKRRATTELLALNPGGQILADPVDLSTFHLDQTEKIPFDTERRSVDSSIAGSLHTSEYDAEPQVSLVNPYAYESGPGILCTGQGNSFFPAGRGDPATLQCLRNALASRDFTFLAETDPALKTAVDFVQKLVHSSIDGNIANMTWTVDAENRALVETQSALSDPRRAGSIKLAAAVAVMGVGSFLLGKGDAFLKHFTGLLDLFGQDIKLE